VQACYGDCGIGAGDVAAAFRAHGFLEAPTRRALDAALAARGAAPAKRRVGVIAGASSGRSVGAGGWWGSGSTPMNKVLRALGDHVSRSTPWVATGAALEGLYNRACGCGWCAWLWM